MVRKKQLQLQAESTETCPKIDANNCKLLQLMIISDRSHLLYNTILFEKLQIKNSSAWKG